ncbi:glutaminyl-peptide cyclotransferase-like protein [Drosophila ananassae]|nr:glutaminyl-peptide cyclotransferase-like protein [Drosophila ananassae]
MVVQNKFREGVNFTNVVAYWNPGVEHVIMLSCHYDTETPRLKNKTYWGATDGAVPCAILLNVAKTMGEYLKNDLSLRMDVGLALVFFDGHKPLLTDPENEVRLIGSRHFVEVDFIPLENIILAINLNLIGLANESYFSYHNDTADLHFKISDLEQELWESKQLTGGPVLFHKLQHYNKDQPDDDYPFHEQGVPVLHISPEINPKIHHTTADIKENLHWPTIRNMIKILRKFLYDYLRSQEFDSPHRGEAMFMYQDEGENILFY